MAESLAAGMYKFMFWNGKESESYVYVLKWERMFWNGKEEYSNTISVSYFTFMYYNSQISRTSHEEDIPEERERGFDALVADFIRSSDYESARMAENKNEMLFRWSKKSA